MDDRVLVLLKIVRHPVLRGHFRTFTASPQAQECVDFLNEIELWQHKSLDAAQEASSLLETSSVPAHIRASIKRNLMAPNSALFKDAIDFFAKPSADDDKPRSPQLAKSVSTMPDLSLVATMKSWEVSFTSDAKKIAASFIRADGPRALTLSSAIKDKILSTPDVSISLSIFDEARDQVALFLATNYVTQFQAWHGTQTGLPPLPASKDDHKSGDIQPQLRRRASSLGSADSPDASLPQTPVKPSPKPQTLSSQPIHVKKRLGVDMDSDDLGMASAYRVKKFFGEELDPKQVAYAARLEATAPSTEAIQGANQPNHIDVKKLQHYFGERPPVSLRREKSDGNVIDPDAEKDPEDPERRLRHTKTMRKVRSILGDGAALEPTQSVQFRQQPDHVLPERLGKKFGEQPAIGRSSVPGSFGGTSWFLLENEGRRVPTVRTADAYVRILEEHMEMTHRSFDDRRKALDELFDSSYDHLVQQLQAEFLKLRSRAHQELEQQRKTVLDELTALRLALDRAQPYSDEWIRKTDHEQELNALRDKLAKEQKKDS